MTTEKKRKNSRAKGSRCEREAAAFLRGLGFKARRGQQFSGLGGAPDVVVDDLPNVWVEVKAVEALDLGNGLFEAAWKQAWRDAADHQTPVLLWKRNRCQWRLSFAARDPNVRATVTGDADIAHVLRRLNAEAA